MNGKTGGCRDGEKGVMNYSSKMEDGRIGCQLTNQARERRGERREEIELRTQKDGKETKMNPEKSLMK